MGDRVQDAAVTARFETVWDCEEPPCGVAYRILEVEWSSDCSVRVVKAWVPVTTRAEAVETR
jgi:hypothetical protein